MAGLIATLKYLTDFLGLTFLIFTIYVWCVVGHALTGGPY